LKTLTWVIIAEFWAATDAYDFEQQLILEHRRDKLIINRHVIFNGSLRFMPKRGGRVFQL
jgi:hypothetical protein